MNKYRLHSTVYDRDIEEETKELKRVFFLSVEGNDTEREYFEGIENFKNELGIDVLIKIEVLSRYKSDTHCAPIHVIQLLEELLELRKENSDNKRQNLLRRCEMRHLRIDFISRRLQTI